MGIWRRVGETPGAEGVDARRTSARREVRVGEAGGRMGGGGLDALCCLLVIESIICKNYVSKMFKIIYNYE